LSWITDNIPTMNHLLLAGTSAGSIGIQFWSRNLLNRIASSSAAVTATTVGVVFDGSTSAQENLNTSFSDICNNEDLDLTADETTKCLNNEFSFVEFMQHTFASHPNIPFGWSNYKFDPTQLSNYCQGLLLEVGEDNCTQAQHYTTMQDVLVTWTGNSSSSGNVINYFHNGRGHVTLGTENLYTLTNNNNDNEPTFLEWIQDIATGVTTIPSSCVEVASMDPAFDFSCNSILTNAVFTTTT